MLCGGSAAARLKVPPGEGRASCHLSAQKSERTPHPPLEFQLWASTSPQGEVMGAQQLKTCSPEAKSAPGEGKPSIKRLLAAHDLQTEVRTPNPKPPYGFLSSGTGGGASWAGSFGAAGSFGGAGGAGG